jgi:outer membrane protein assembly factor BamB
MGAGVELLTWLLLLTAASDVLPSPVIVALSGATMPGQEVTWLEPLPALRVGRSAFQTPLLIDGLVVAWSGDGAMYAWETTAFTEVWSEKWGRAPITCWGTGDGVVVGLGYPRNRVLMIDPATGDTEWCRKRVDPSCPALMTGGAVLLGTSFGEIVALAAADGNELWRLRVCADALSGLALAGGGTVAASLAGEVVCVEGDDVSWRRTLGGNCYGGPSVAQGVIVCTTFGGEVVALDTRGELLWSHATGQRLRSRACVGRGIAVVATGEGDVLAYRLADGALVWQRTLDGVLRSSPTLLGRMVLVGALQGKGWLIDAESGALCDSVQVSGPLGSQPAIAPGLLAWCSWDGLVNVWKIRPSGEAGCDRSPSEVGQRTFLEAVSPKPQQAVLRADPGALHSARR